MSETLLASEAVAVSVEAANRQEAVRAAGNLLVSVGACEPRYVDAMCQALDELGPYCVLAPGIALPHARPEDGVLRSALSVVTLRAPVSFGHESNDPVRLVIGLAPVDKNAHLKTLQHLAVRLMEPDIVDRLCAASHAEAVRELLGVPGTSDDEPGHEPG